MESERKMHSHLGALAHFRVAQPNLWKRLMNQRNSILSMMSIVAMALVTAMSASAHAQGPAETYVELRSGMRLGPGVVRTTETISENSYAKAAAAESGAKPIGVLDDNLRYTFFNFSKNSVIGQQVTNRPRLVIELPYKAEIETSASEQPITGILGISQFNKFGRRTYSVQIPGKSKNLLQAITAISPLYCQVETLRVSDSIAWDQRIATRSIPDDLLREILHQHLDLTQPNNWKTIIQFYLESERFTEARDELKAALEKFPNDFEASMLTQLDELNAAKLFNEVKLRQDAGQYQFASEFLNVFDLKTLPLEVQLRVQTQFETLKQNLVTVSEIVEAIKKDVQLLPPADQQLIDPLVKEIVGEINLDSVARLADYQRLRADESLPTEQRVALAVGGWILGSGAGLDNFATAKSLVRVRELVRQFLVEQEETKRTQLLSQIKTEEGGRPDFVVKILASMKPPKTPPPVAKEDPAGLHRLEIQLGKETVKYVVQTPPEYDPNRVYPCVVSLPSLGTNPDYQVNWWCGTSIKVKANEADEERQERYGQATRNGYIVISPVWAAPGQLQYNYSEIEHARVLKCYRDALRHFSIDTDKVFISGHQAGATCAWDLALAHPDLWAGGVMVSPTAEKFIVHYGENAVLVPMYFVYGERDGSGFRDQIGKTVDKYLVSSRYDALAVCYRGREGGFFPEETERIMEWMQLSSHRRVRNPKEIKVSTMRPGDRFFYWVEAPDFATEINSFAFKPASTGIEANLMAKNGISVSQYPTPTVWVWLTPDLVDFSLPVVVRAKGTTKRFDVSSDLDVILEDARTRVDRLHPFHFKISFP